MVFVKGGTFTMGCTPEQEAFCAEDEKPAREVTVGDFYISSYLVTQKEWIAMMGSCPTIGYYRSPYGDNMPVTVNSSCVPKFIEKLNAETGKKYRLATEAEWEYAARGGAESKGYVYSGGDNIDEVAWYGKDWKSDIDPVVRHDHEQSKLLYQYYSKPHPVGTLKPNELGLYDMSGNPGEWVSDCYAPYGPSPQINPKVQPDRHPKGYPAPCLVQAYRGAGWRYGEPQNSRVSARHKTDALWMSMGIRLALDKTDGGRADAGYQIFTKDGYKRFAPKNVPVKGEVGVLFNVPEPNTVGSIDGSYKAVTIMDLGDGKKKANKRIITKDIDMWDFEESVFRFDPNVSDDAVVYSKTNGTSTGFATIVNIKTGKAIQAEFDNDSKYDNDVMSGIRYLDPENNLFAVAKSVFSGDIYNTWVDNLRIARLKGNKLIDLGLVMPNIGPTDCIVRGFTYIWKPPGNGYHIVPGLLPYNRWTVHDRKLIAYDNSRTKEMRCFNVLSEGDPLAKIYNRNGINETTHPFAEVFNRNKDKIGKDALALRDFAIHPELPFGLVAAKPARPASGAGKNANALFLLRWDIETGDGQWTDISQKLLPLARLFGIKDAVFAYPSFSPDGEWFAIGCFNDDSSRNPYFIAIPAGKEFSDFLNMEELVALGQAKDILSINWATAPTALVVSCGGNNGKDAKISKWDLGELHNAIVINEQEVEK
jgi:formylglycine-generating enzyme required for sulfatase activity